MARILIVDDRPAVLVLIDQVLRPQGHTLIYAQDGRRALLELQSSSFDLLVTDLMMPETTGFDILKWVCEHAPGLPVLVCSAHANGEELKTLMGRHPYRVVVKPFRKQQFTDAAAELLAP